MASIDKVEIDVSDFMSDINAVVKITGINRLVWKCRIAEALVRLAGWVLGCKIEIV